MDILSGDFGTGGARECVVELCYTGLLGEAFTAFAVHRAEKLSLRGWVEANGPNRITVYAEGPEVLVDAFEITCALGPIESRVESWTRHELTASAQFSTFERC